MLRSRPEDQPPLAQHFESEDRGHEWHLTCRKCGKRWALDKSSKHPGNHLYLLNHAASHNRP